MSKEVHILYEDNHIMIVNKPSGIPVQPDNSGDPALEDELKEFIKMRDGKPGKVYLGVVHRIDRPVSGAVMFAKTSKALTRLNEMVKNREIKKTYWAITYMRPEKMEDTLVNYILRDGKTNKSRCVSSPGKEAKEAKLKYKVVAGSDNFTMLEIQLITGRHHQIRCQLSKIDCPIKGDLKYGAKRSNKDGSISLHARKLEFIHPVKKEVITVTAPTPQDDNLWRYFEKSQE
ncbi:MAG: RNA pseudouridine synthase [Rikenellaceae bacterium]|nr:RNA pseudouridine synthase [Rikenellaceae bacterium]